MKNLLVAVCLSIATMPAWSETDAEKGLAIAVETDKRDSNFVDFSAAMEMELIGRNGKKSSRKMRQKTMEVEKDGDKAVIVFDYPRNVKGTGLLTHSHKIGDDDQWLYLPVRGRVKRIASSNKSGAFMGSEFAYEDMSSQEIEKYTDFKYLRDEKVNGQDCFVIHRIPVDKLSGYSRQTVWIDQAEYRVQKIDFFDVKNAHMKTLIFLDYQKYIDEFWKPGRLEMKNHITNKGTNLIWTDYKFKTGVTDADFRKTSLKRIR
jgi:outer membrane lipoprotein-sorting protein